MSDDFITGASLLYCTAAPDLSVGDLLSASDHGRRTLDRVVLRKGPPVSIPNPGWAGATFYELAFELVRMREFPHLPSRLNCLYLWLDEIEAREFYFNQWQSEKSAHFREEGTPPFPWAPGLYEVEVMKIVRIHAANMVLISYFEAEDNLSKMMTRGRAYWSAAPGDEHPVCEILLEGQVRISRVLDA